MSSNGMTYAPMGRPSPVVKPGEFAIAAIGLDHGHIYGQCNGLTEAGAHVKWVFDEQPARAAKFAEKYPGCRVARSESEVLEDGEVRLVAAAAIPNQRGALGCRVMRAGKDYFTDKTPFTTLAQLAEAKRVVVETGRKYMVYFSERLHVECATVATRLVDSGAIGRPLQVIGMGPHRLGTGRPDWFFTKEQYGGILCDIGSHQIEQFLHYCRVDDATVVNANVANYANAGTPEFEDFGEANLVGSNGCSNYFRVDWFTPAGLRTWGDGRLTILGTEGYIELRKYVDIGSGAAAPDGDVLILVNKQGESRINCAGTDGFPYFGRLIRDCLDRAETAMTQAHAFKAAELCLKAQLVARRLA